LSCLRGRVDADRRADTPKNSTQAPHEPVRAADVGRPTALWGRSVGACRTGPGTAHRLVVRRGECTEVGHGLYACHAGRPRDNEGNPSHFGSLRIRGSPSCAACLELLGFGIPTWHRFLYGERPEGVAVRSVAVRSMRNAAESLVVVAGTLALASLPYQPRLPRW
jgi:hypothetical protein